MKKIITGLLIFFCLPDLQSQIFQDNLRDNNLINSAAISVTIGGQFPLTGTFPALITERTDEFITRMYGEATEIALRTLSDKELFRRAKDELANYSMRGIKIKRITGEVLEVDLEKFRTTGDFKYNPYLKNDDVIIFPPHDLIRNFFTVSGAVNRPGTFDFVEGDKLMDAILLARGINEAYEKIDSIVIVQLSYDGNIQTSVTVDINNNRLLQRGDHIRVIARETQKRNFSILVLGEVNSPGSIPITYNKTRLYDVINQSGGLTERASLRRARLYTGNSLSIFLEKLYGINLSEQPDMENPQFRRVILDIESILMYRMSNILPEDSSYFFLENQLRILTEGSSLDFAEIEDPNSDIANYIVKSGDVVVIPQIQNSVYIFGQVARPGHINLVEGRDYNYYIKEAGGLGELAEEDEIMVIKGGSRTWISPINNKVEIEEGDYIYIPKQNLRSFRSYVFEYSVYVSLLASVAAILIGVVNLAK